MIIDQIIKVVLLASLGLLVSCETHPAVGSEGQNVKKQNELMTLIRNRQTSAALEIIQTMDAHTLDAELPDPPAYVTLLELSCQNGQLPVVKSLIEKGCRINRIVDAGFALGDAAASNNIEVVQYLLEKGADVNLYPASTNQTALDLALANGNDEVVAFLKAKVGKSSF